MKLSFKLFSAILLFQFQGSLGQTVVSDVVKVDSTIRKSTLFSNGLSWFAYQFKSSNDVIQMKDLESGKIIGKGIFDYVNKKNKLEPRYILITLTVRDGKYKYDIELDILREFQLELKASCFNCGKTIATITQTNSSVQISNIIGGRGFYHYDNENVGWVERGNYKKWKVEVDTELPEIKNKMDVYVKELIKSQDELDNLKIKVFVDSLKSEMMKKSSDF